MFVDYTQLVLRSYQERQANGILSPRLIHPTPARLKEECEAVFSARYERKDQKTLSVFFGEFDTGEAGLKAIKRCETDKFKPLVKFLRKETKVTEDKNIELLAWLIDFDERPYKYGKRYVDEVSYNDADEKVGKDLNKEEVADNFDVSTERVPVENLSLTGNLKGNRFRFKAKPVILIFVVLIAAAGFTYWKLEDKPETRSFLSMNPEGCMCWVGDRYEQVSCNKNHGDTLVVALDTFKLKHLRKINSPDTITQNAIGSVWYIKVNGNIEYFTCDGYYPPDPKRKLKPITGYIIEKYIHRPQ